MRAGVYLGADHVGFGRMITDRASFGHLADVYLLEAHRDRGFSTELVATLPAHPDWVVHRPDAPLSQ